MVQVSALCMNPSNILKEGIFLGKPFTLTYLNTSSPAYLLCRDFTSKAISSFMVPNTYYKSSELKKYSSP